MFIVMTFFIYITLFKGQDFNKIFKVITLANPIILIFAFLLIILFILCEAFNINILLNSMNYKKSLINSIKYAIAGFFYSSITPSSTGGQPMQLYKMKRDGINLYHSTLILLVELACFQTITLIFGFISLIWIKATSMQIPDFIRFLAGIGFSINALILIGIWISIFSKEFLLKIYHIIHFLINKAFFISDTQRKKLCYCAKSNLDKYNECASFFKTQPFLILKCLFITTIQVGAMFSIPYMVYLALNKSPTSYTNMFMMQSIVYSASSFIPLPGASGVSENNYIHLFSKIYPIEVLNSGVIITRCVNFYFPLILSFGILLCIQIVYKYNYKFKKT